MELTDKVLINNLCDWALYFRRLNGVGDIRVPARVKNFAMLDVAEVQMQIQSGNKLFIGNDEMRPGDHARLFIVDDKQRKELLGYGEETGDDALVLNAESVTKLLAVKKKEDFNRQLEELVKTDAEKKMVVQLAKEAGGDDVAAWKMEAINKLAETTVL